MKRLQRTLPATGPPAKALQALSVEVADLTDKLPMIEVLCNPALREPHWIEIKRVLSSDADPLKLTLSQFRLL